MESNWIDSELEQKYLNWCKWFMLAERHNMKFFMDYSLASAMDILTQPNLFKGGN